jgi:outer membrane protein TolC
MIGRLLVATLVLLCSFSPGLTAELTLRGCVDLALQNNNGLKAAEEELAAAREAGVISRAGFFPALRLKGGYSLLDQAERLIVEGDSFAPGIPPTDTELPVGDQSFYELNLSLTQPLFTGGRLTHTHRRAERMHDETRHRLDRRKRELSRDVELAFNQALNDQLFTEVLAKAIQAKGERLRVLKALEEEGYIGREEVLQQETDLLFTELDLTRSQNSEQLNRRRLAHLIGNEVGLGQLRLVGKSFNAALTLSLADVLAAALRQREELLAAASRVEVLGEEIAIARSGYYPQFSLEGRYTRQKETNLTRDDAWLLAAQLEWSLFEWGSTNAEVRQKAARKRKAQYQRRELENAVLLEAEQVWRAVKEAEQAIAAHDKQLKTSEFRWSLVVERYAEGNVQLADLIEAEADLLKAYHQYLMAINNLDADLARLEAAASLSLEPYLLPGTIYTPEQEFAATRSDLSLPLKASGTSTDVRPKKPVDASSGTGADVVAPSPLQTVSADNHPTLERFNYAVQVGSFKNRRNAESQVLLLEQKIPQHSIVLTKAGDFHRVRIVGFSSKKDAQKATAQAGIPDYLILRTQ